MPAEPRPASSLLVLRDRPGAPEVYMVRRHPSSPFAGGALVFLGGRVDELDASPELAEQTAGLAGESAARRLGLPSEQTPRARAHYVAAAREALEEGGLLIATPPPAEDALRELRRALLERRASFDGLLAERGLRLALDELRYLDHWVTPEVEPRRYDTRFFVCRAPAGQDASADPHETTGGAWLTVESALADHGAELWPPTLVILERLRAHASVDAILAAAPDRPLAPTQPRLLLEGAEITLLLPGDARYDDPARRGGPEDCVVLRGGRWHHLTS
jgi:8-oxo-dGTP pyrophosphatase MutT (NUDIX family)